MAIQPATAVSAPGHSPRAEPAGSAPARTPAPQAIPVRMTAEQVEQVVKEMKQVVEPVVHNLQFSIDDTTGQTVVMVVDSGTKEVIRQIPSEELLDIARTLNKLQGLLLHRKA